MEEDDIDDLLDEVEMKFCSSKSQNKRSNSSNTEERRKTKSHSLTSKEELDLAIADICAADDFDIKNVYDMKTVHNTKTHNDLPTAKKSSSTSTKCFPVFVGSATDSQGLSTIAHQRACDALHCTSCDQRVIQFPEYKWNKSCDYLFFRNNYPDYDRLKVNLIRSKDKQAYSCQCCWLSVDQIQKLDEALSKSKSRWICSGH